MDTNAFISGYSFDNMYERYMIYHMRYIDIRYETYVVKPYEGVTENFLNGRHKL